MPALTKSSSLKKAGSMKVSRIESKYHEEADIEDEKWEQDIKAANEKRPGTWSRLTA